MSLSALWSGFTLGLGAAAPIGPINIEIARRSIHGGRVAGFLLGCGAVTVDVVYVLAASLGFGRLVDRRAILIPLAIAAAGLLAFLGISSLLAARRRLAADLADTPPASIKHNYVTGVMMTSLNPMTLIFWFLTSTVAGRLQSASGSLHFLALGVACGAMCWVIFFASLMGAAGAVARRATLVAADIAGAIMLLGFAAWTIWTVARRYL